MASAEGGSVSSGVAYGEGCPLSSRLRGLGERRELPSWVRGRAPAENAILAYVEGHRMLIFVPIWQNLGGGQFVLASPRSKFWGDLSPLFPPPVIYAHESIPDDLGQITTGVWSVLFLLQMTTVPEIVETISPHF